jgi:hypothetical protein
MQKIHVDAPRMFECDQCGKTFKHKSTFVAHMQGHITTYIHCPQSQEPFKFESELTEHLKMTHNNVLMLDDE